MKNCMFSNTIKMLLYDSIRNDTETVPKTNLTVNRERKAMFTAAKIEVAFCFPKKEAGDYTY